MPRVRCLPVSRLLVLLFAASTVGCGGPASLPTPDRGELVPLSEASTEAFGLEVHHLRELAFFVSAPVVFRGVRRTRRDSTFVRGGALYVMDESETDHVWMHVGSADTGRWVEPVRPEGVIASSPAFYDEDGLTETTSREENFEDPGTWRVGDVLWVAFGDARIPFGPVYGGARLGSMGGRAPNPARGGRGRVLHYAPLPFRGADDIRYRVEASASSPAVLVFLVRRSVRDLRRDSVADSLQDSG